MILSNKKGLGILVVILMIHFGCYNRHEKKNKLLEGGDSLVTFKKQSVSQQKIDLHNPCEVLSGKIFTYLPQQEMNSHAFTLKFECHQGNLKGLIFGPNPQGEHGLAFYKAELQNLIINDSLNITFSYVPGELYEEQITLENYTKRKEGAGFLRSELLFKGRLLIKDTTLALNCFNEYNDCYTQETMLFKLHKTR